MTHQDVATKIVMRLVEEGFKAYFAGGWVRDYLMKHPSDDIDIATDAPTEVLLDLFPRTILVGLSFGVVIVVMEGHQFEVATFRRDIEYVGGRRPTRIEPSTPEEDASRRDFTINGMFYDPIEKVVHDYVGGAEDIKLRIIRTIGDPYERFTEDRLRMIRAVRFASRFSFVIDEETKDAVRSNADTLFPAVAMERVWHEFCKMARYPNFDHAMIEMHRLDLLPVIFPQLKEVNLHEIKERVAPVPHYLPHTDPILSVLALFPHATPSEVEELCRYLRTSQAEFSIGAYFMGLKIRPDLDTEAYDKLWWARAYSHPKSNMCLHAVAAAYPQAEKEALLLRHAQRLAVLQTAVDRLVKKTPVVNASRLMKEGIVPGKSMGVLLNEAEKLAIHLDCDNPDVIIEHLKKATEWK